MNVTGRRTPKPVFVWLMGWTLETAILRGTHGVPILATTGDRTGLLPASAQAPAFLRACFLPCTLHVPEFAHHIGLPWEDAA